MRPERTPPGRLLLWAALLSCAAPAFAQNQTPGEAQPGSGAARILTFIEVAATSAGDAARILRQYRAGLRSSASSVRVELLQELDRPGRFALLESADAGADLDASEARLQPTLESLQPLLSAPLDRRANRDFAPAANKAGAARSRLAASPLYVLAHLDIAPPATPAVRGALENLANAARRSDGNQGFDVWQQANRGNHFNFVSVWTSRRNFEAFAAGAGAREFRTAVARGLGSPYDERLYRAL